MSLVFVRLVVRPLLQSHFRVISYPLRVDWVAALTMAKVVYSIGQPKMTSFIAP